MTGLKHPFTHHDHDRITAMASNRDRALATVRWLTAAGGTLAVLATTGTAIAIAASTPAHHSTALPAVTPVAADQETTEESGPSASTDDVKASSTAKATAKAHAKRTSTAKTTTKTHRTVTPVQAKPAPVQARPVPKRVPVAVQPAPQPAPAPVTSSGS